MGPNRLDDQQHDAGGDTDIGHIEDAGAEGTNAEVHEVDHATIIHDAIQEIAQPAAQHETPGNGGRQWYRLSKENNRQDDQTQGREDLEEKDADPPEKPPPRLRNAPVFSAYWRRTVSWNHDWGG